MIFSICPKSTAEAISADDFYKKNIVTMGVGFSLGGSSDYAARLLASYWSEVTNSGTMVIKNMGGLKCIKGNKGHQRMMKAVTIKKGERC